MDRRRFLQQGLFAAAGTTVSPLLGCRNKQHAAVVAPGQPDMVGSHQAGAETFKPLVEQATGNLLGRHVHGVQPAGVGVGVDAAPGERMRVCFVAVENKSAEEIGDFKEQIYQVIDTKILQSPAHQPINKRFVDAALRETRLRPDELFVPQNMRMFAATLEQQGQPFDYLLYATITSGTTRSNGDYQRDYLLTLEMVNVQTGAYDKESASIRKGYTKTALGQFKHYNPLAK